MLTVTVGVPYFVLSSTGPLVQAWFCRTFPGRSPYRLYALSNVGSLVALLSYPFLFEPAFSVGTQALCWSVGFVRLWPAVRLRSDVDLAHGPICRTPKRKASRS